MQSGLGNRYPVPPQLYQPVAVIGQVEDYDAETNTVRVMTQEFGYLTCHVGCGYMEAQDYNSAGIPSGLEDGDSYGHKRPYRKRERVVVLRVGGMRSMQGIVICSVSKIKHQMNSGKISHSSLKTDKTKTEMLHIPVDLWFRTLKTLTVVSMKELTILVEDASASLTAKQDITIDAQDGKFAVTSKQALTLESTDADASIKAKTAALLKGQTANVEADTTTTIEGKQVKLGAGASSEVVLLGTTFLQVLNMLLTLLETWGTSHLHPCTAPGTPSGPPIPPLSGMLTGQLGGQMSNVMSTKIFVEK